MNDTYVNLSDKTFWKSENKLNVSKYEVSLLLSKDEYNFDKNFEQSRLILYFGSIQPISP